MPFSFDTSNLPKKKKISPLKKSGNNLSVQDIIHSDKDYAEVSFISGLMMYSLTSKQMQERYQERFGQPISIARINKLRQMARNVYLAQIGRNRDEMVAEELMKMQKREIEAMEAFEKSKGGRKKTRTKTSTSTGNAPELNFDMKETEEEIIENGADVNYLRELREISRQRIDLLGLEAPKAQPEQTGSALPNVVINVVGSRKDIKAEDAVIIDGKDGAAEKE